MDDIRSSFSKMKMRLEHRLTGGKRKRGGAGANSGGETTDSMSSLPQSEPHVVAGGSHDIEGDRANVAGERVFLTDPPQPAEPESVPARESDNGQGGEVSQRHSHTHPHVEVAVGSGHSGEPEGLHPSPSTPSISHSGKLDGT